MSSSKELIIIERRRADTSFILEVAQRGRNKPKKYRHYLSMPYALYDELKASSIITPEAYYIDESGFFEFLPDSVKISFICLYQCEDLHRKIDHYLVKKCLGSYPLTRGGIFF